MVITKSTVPVGTGDEVERVIRELRPGNDVAVVSNPEFLREGAAIHDFKHPDRIVVGTDDERARKIVAEIYRPLYQPGADSFTERRTASSSNTPPMRSWRPRSPSSTRSRICASASARTYRRWHAVLGSTIELGRVSACRPGLRRLVLPEGRACIDQDRTDTTCRCASSRRSRP